MGSGETTEKVGLEPFSLKEGLWHHGWFNQKTRLQGHPQNQQERIEKTQPGSSQRCVVARRKAVAQVEIWEAQAGDKKKPFP